MPTWVESPHSKPVKKLSTFGPLYSSGLPPNEASALPEIGPSGGPVAVLFSTPWRGAVAQPPLSSAQAWEVGEWKALSRLQRSLPMYQVGTLFLMPLIATT